jgi:hypothetical protein
MRGKFLFFLGLGLGYVLGTRAGRRRYEQIKAAAQNIWESEPIQWSVHQAQEAVGDVADDVLTAAKRVIHQVTGDKPAPKRTVRAGATRTSAAKTTAKTAATTAARPAAKPATQTPRTPTAEPAARKSAPKSTPEA